MKVRIKNEFGAPINLLEASNIEFYFPREDGNYLRKTEFFMTNPHMGELEFDFKPFELQALKQGKEQDFFAKLHVQDEVLTIRFAKAMTVSLKEERKVLNDKGSFV